MALGLILSISGLVLLAPVGNDGHGLIADPARRFDAVAVLLAAGVSLLLASRRPLGFWLVLTIVGSIGYVTEQTSPWAPPGWHNRVVLISVVLFTAATLLSAVPAPQTADPALTLTVVIGGILWLGRRYYPAVIPWSYLVDAFVVMATVVLVLWLRGANRSRAGLVLTAGGVVVYTLEQVRPWAPAGWHDRITVVAAIAAIIGILTAFTDYVGRGAFGMAFVAGAGWGVGAMVARHQQPWRIRIDPSLSGALEIASAGLLVAAVAALVCFAIQVVTEVLRQYREDVDSRLAEFCTSALVVSGGGFVLAATSLTSLRVFDQSSLGASVLFVLMLAGLVVGFAGVWAGFAAVVGLPGLSRPPKDIDEMREFLTGSVSAGPRGLGSGPVIAYAGVALLFCCAFVVSAAAAWFTLGLLGGALVVAGATMFVGQFVRGLGRLLPEDQARRAVAACGAAVVLLFLVRSEGVPDALRFLLSLGSISGFVVAFAEAPVHLLVSLQGKADDVGWDELKGDRRLRRPRRLALAGLIASVAAIVWVTSFGFGEWLRAILTLTAILGFGMVFAFGVFTIVTVTETIRTGDRTLADRAQRIATTKGNLYRLLPTPKRIQADLDLNDLDEESPLYLESPPWIGRSDL